MLPGKIRIRCSAPGFVRPASALLSLPWQARAPWTLDLSSAWTFKAIFENAVQRQALEAEFAAFVLPLFEGKELGDPKSGDRVLKLHS